MKQLIRFEDDYGVSDIVCIAHGLGLGDLADNRLTRMTKDENIFVQSGLSIGAVFDISDIVISEILEYKINEIIFVFDMDAISGKGIMTESELQNKVSSIKQRLTNVDIHLKYAPIVWSAETFALYIMLDTRFEESVVAGKRTDITHIIHAKNTVKLHGTILKKLLNHFVLGDSIKIKHTRDFIGDKNNILDKLSVVVDNCSDSINKDVLQWIITGNTSYLFNSESVIGHQKDIIQLHTQFLPKDDEKIMVYEDELSLTKVCWR